LNALGGLEIALPTATVETAEIKVYVSGAEARPGDYTLRPDDRLEEALRAAGGGTPDADLLAINLAARLRDEQQVVVPTRMPGSLPMLAPLDINIASVEALQALPGIGPVRAAAIVRYREEHGPFPDVQALDQVPGLGPTTVDRLKGMVVAR
ncbi:MAG: ComEA family DNA-binding protein, partial [Chloroflexi bacterium]|nr:ComEA family DNA-binding protein [Chloroflexota bacterium]